MEGRRTPSSQRQLPQAAIVAAAAAAEALALCTRLRAAAADVPTCRRDCRCVAGGRACRGMSPAGRACWATDRTRSRGGSCARHLAWWRRVGPPALLPRHQPPDTPPCTCSLSHPLPVLFTLHRRTLSRFVGKVQLVLEALQPAMMQQAAALAEAAAAEAGGGPGEPDMQALGSGGLADAWSAALRDSPADSPASQHRRRRSDGAAPIEPPSPYEPARPREALVAAWAEAVNDVREALAAAAELVTGCTGMGRLQVRVVGSGGASGGSSSIAACSWRPAWVSDRRAAASVALMHRRCLSDASPLHCPTFSTGGAGGGRAAGAVCSHSRRPQARAVGPAGEQWVQGAWLLGLAAFHTPAELPHCSRAAMR